MSNKNKKILLVEDDKIYISAVQDALSGEGFDVIVAEDGEDGFNKVQKEKPDLAILDIMLPKMNGIDLAKKIKASGIILPIIFLTNMGDMKHISEAVEAAQTDYILKSDFSAKDIIAKIKNKLNIK